ncbi:MAG TPA: prepilin-type N-terminal cleavage/methylation domain-containing protein [Sumerlaeia bacterium]|nr:prepilin-type N-terminal cleavage/methylation domain-containing protein [Sumerlaeia bacterium]
MRGQKETPRPRAFTLIELLIVVAIIAILAAIAVPNFLEAQTRSKISRVKSDFRSVGVALEAYFIDNQTYPDMAWIAGNVNFSIGLRDLTTPVAYITSIPWDPFTSQNATGDFDTAYEYGSGVADVGPGDTLTQPNNIWFLESEGPDNTDLNLTPAFPYERGYNLPQVVDWIYDPTNGTRSRGSIYRTGGVLPSRDPMHTFCQLIDH